MDLLEVSDAGFWTCGLCSVMVPLGTPHECEPASAFSRPPALERVAVALERIAAALEGN